MPTKTSEKGLRMITSKLQRRILLGKIMDIDIDGLPYGLLKAKLSEHPDSESLTKVYDTAVEKLNEQPSAEDMVTKALESALDTAIKS
tara:strand:- start:921 stop:1184 length:264 start_codon:yes stop_codon:yes gene_type:complete